MVTLKSAASRTDVIKIWGDLEAGKHENQEFDNVTHTKVFKAKVKSFNLIFRIKLFLGHLTSTDQYNARWGAVHNLFFLIDRYA